MNMKHTNLGRLLVLLVVLLAGTLSLWAQGNASLQINEVLVTNQSNLIDEYGNRSSWIELHNPSAATIDVGGMYLTDDPSSPSKYPIRMGRTATFIEPYQSLVIFLDGMPQHGTLHSGLTIDPNVETTIYLYDNDGKLLIDQVTLPANIPADQSYGRIDDAEEWGIIALPTPNEVNNYTQDKAERIAHFKKNDPSGIVMTLIAVPVVFIALIILYLVFKAMGNYNVKRSRKKVAKVQGKTIDQVKAEDVSADVYAAIAMALYQTLSGVHDDEHTVITIEQTKRRYSPWSSKIHTLRRMPGQE